MTTPSTATPAQANERQPLLETQARAEQLDAVPEDFDETLGEPELRPRRKRSKAKIAWYTLGTLLSAFFLALFIKGWIDSKDVDVRSTRSHWGRMC